MVGERIFVGVHNRIGTAKEEIRRYGQLDPLK